MKNIAGRLTIFKSFFTSSSYLTTARRTPRGNPPTPRPRSTSPPYSQFIEHLRNDRLDEARKIFNRISSPSNIQLYTRMISGYTQNNKLDEALLLFHQIPPDIKDTVSWNSMMKGCLDCDRLEIALDLFDKMPEKNVVSWTTIINGFTQSGNIKKAEELFKEMPWGWRDTAAWNSMLFGYCSNGRMKDACKLFDEMPNRNVISWTTMINGLERSGKNEEALKFFRRMRVLGRVEPTSSTLSCILTACAKIPALRKGIQLHTHLVKSGYYAVDMFISASLITFYANCKEIESSAKAFEENVYKESVVIWTALVTGYGFNSKHKAALGVFHSMMKARVLPNQSTFTSVLNSCCELDASLDRGRAIHGATIKVGLNLDVYVANSLVVMYAKCGNMDDGLTVFTNMRKRNLVSWNSVIVGCAQNGHEMWSLELFDQMVSKSAKEVIKPDEITFVGLLTACSRSNLLVKAKYYFDLLKRDPSLEVKIEHCACMVDALGRSGKLKEAEEFIMNMPVKANCTIWLTLLSACRAHANIELARRAAQSVWDIDPHNSAAYVLLSNIYSSVGRFNDASQVRQLMDERGVVKQAGSSWLDSVQLA